ncbi:MAG: phosphoribosylanthranilate isomerase [Humidesulfovibrio sp.]|uniref:phosphoribosylanthranilate isomerase n=1 Tax=Humidesulfovibrio sp. TaxID=2910988 RepID=UPI0027F57A7B|nr:phosphoribosylanthranilate isomerase [Humidesulfovibrio sp.]MDQ7836539.1 phosphoribosylanthranilate isomerase [Humidesulfovibrio sp.]
MTNGLLVKVCGMTREEDALRCAELGADLLGFIFHPGSPRNTTPEFPADLRLPGVRKVGLFVDQKPMEALGIMAAGRLDMAQLHGGQTESFCAVLAERMGPGRIIKVFWPEKAASLEAFQAELDRYAPYCGHMLVDAGKGGGGHGREISDKAAEILAGAKFPRPWLLAGGLNPENLPGLISRYRAPGAPAQGMGMVGVDLNSGVEKAPGQKDETLLRAAFAAIKATGAAQTQGVTP